MNSIKRMLFVLIASLSILGLMAPMASAAVGTMDGGGRDPKVLSEVTVMPVLAEGLVGPVLLAPGGGVATTASAANHSTCGFNSVYAYNGPSTGKTMMYASASCGSGTGRHILSGSIKPLYGSTVYSSGLFFSTYGSFYLNSQSYYVGTYTLRADVCGVNDGLCRTWVSTYWVG